ncbi:MAG: DUF4238 domain-containing protein [Gammaproteobacteria bacterium]|nr:DUF4238 domain-containing protein [Gammaproteobacteria bacterium]
MTQQESHRHHFVPEFLLKPWAENGELNGFWWDSRKRRLTCNRRGPKAFCNEFGLLTVQYHERGRDVLERDFFGPIDSKGALVRDQLLADGAASLSGEERRDFARLLLSLEARRPMTVHKLRGFGTQFLIEVVDDDPEIQREMVREGIAGKPSDYLKTQQFSFEDRALSNIQGLVDNERICGKLINMKWRVIHLGLCDGELLLSDRPLVRCFGYDHPSAAWFLPLTPNAAFCAVNQPGKLDRTTPQRIAKRLNVASAGQAEKYVFCTDTTHTRWLPRYLAT